MSDHGHLRREYGLGGLTDENLRDDPIQQFRLWFAQAEAADLEFPDAMTLATANEDGRPDARIVVLRGFDERGFRFFTSYGSVKAGELDGNPRAALVFFWSGLERQVRIRGRVERLPREESEAYFASRPRRSQIAAAASPQSRPVKDRAQLEAAFEETETRHSGDAVPAPENWGGYRVTHEEVEFWQGRLNRLHDRFLYRRDGGGWTRVRLAP